MGNIMVTTEFQGDARPPPRPPRPGATHTGLRALLFALALASLIVMLQSKQTVYVSVAGVLYPVPVPAKCTQSPTLILRSGNVDHSLYMLITAIASLCFVLTEPVSRAGMLLIYLIWDVMMLVLGASATGRAGATAYIGFEVNEHAGWAKVCDGYETFCHRMAASIIVWLNAGLMLTLLITLSSHSLHRGVPK